MKIALITIHNVPNYGAVLQAFATKETLANFGEVKVIDYQNRYLSYKLDLIRFKFSVHGVKMAAHDLINIYARYRMIGRFKKFIETYLDLTATIGNKTNLKEKFEDFDVYVCGSDQIWNPNIVTANNEIDPMFFLSFAPKTARKLSYASSIGHHNYSVKEKEIVKDLLKDFSKISIREMDGKQKLLDLFPNREIQVVLDPTLLLTKNEWLQKFRITENQSPKEKYILVYSVPRTDLLKKAVEYFSKKLNYKVINIDKMFVPIIKTGKQINDAGPREFLEIYANASFVISDSFHGLCFSLNFEKPFVAISANKGANRQESLLNQLGLKDQIMYSENDFDNLVTEINYYEIREKLDQLRNNSLNYLKSAVVGV